MRALLRPSYLGITRAILLALVLLALFVFTPLNAYAATIYSNSATGNDTTGDGSSGNPYKTFYKAYTSASAADTLNLTGTFTWTDADETGDASGTGYTISKNLTILGQSADATFIQAASSANTADRGVFTIGSGITVTIKNVTIRYGVSAATETAGGITNSGTLTIQNSKIVYNKYSSTASYGAGGITLKHSSNGTVNISTSTVAYNNFDGKYYGSGGLYAGQSNTINITASTFHNNHATSSNPTDFAYSYAEPSGAMGVFRFVTTNIINSTFSNNSTNSYAGAMQVYYPYSFKVTNSTIANNTASAGAGGILFESVTDGYNLHMKNSILANNTGNGSANDFHVISGSAGRITDNGYNIVEFSTNKTWSGTGNITGSQASLNLDSSLADNSATNGVQTLALSSGSVAIDAGNSTTHSSVVIPTTDQRGGTRSGTGDIGSFEYGAGGIADVVAPSVSVSSPTGGSTIGGSISLSASASDNVSVAGVSFYVNNQLVGSEDTGSPYAVSWNSTAVDNGETTAFAVARDTSNNYATSTSVTFTVDNTNPIISAVATTTATTTATITWTTSEAASTKVNFGITSSYGTSTPETDISPRTISHSVTLTGLKQCAKYYFNVQSTDNTANTSTSTAATFYTTGCTGGAVVSATGGGTITTASGGTFSEGKIALTVPVSFTATSSSATFQAHLLDATSFFASAGTVSGKTRAGSTVYNLVALTDATTTLSTFTADLSMTLSYTADDVAGVDESTLKIYRYDGLSWSALSSCSVDTGAKTVTCSTTSFSDFALFGDETEDSPASYSGTSISGRVRNLLMTGNTVRAQELMNQYPKAFLNQVGSSSSVAPVNGCKLETSTRTLRIGSEGSDVRSLQTFLNCLGFTLSNVGAGSPGNETTTFSTRTHEALIRFQEHYASDILTPLNLKIGTGVFGDFSRRKAQALISM